jgi:spore germination protein (amino acid permease)
MIHTKTKISFVQTFMVMMLFNGLLSHVILNPILLDVSGRDAWITVLCTAALYLPWCALLVFIMKKANGQKMQLWLAEQTSPFFSWLLIIPLAIQLYFIGGMTLTHTSLWAVSNYLPETPQNVLIIALILACYYLARSGINAIAIGSGLLLPAVVTLGYLVAFGNIPEKDWVFLRPFLEEGWGRIFSGMLYAGGAFVELSLLLLLQHRLKKKVHVWQMMLLGFVLVLITLGPIIGAITEFGPKEAAKQLVSPYDQWRLLKLGNYVEHVDFFSIFQWLSGATIRISLSLFLLTDLFSFQQPKSRNRFLAVITVSYVLLTIIINYYNTFFLWIFERYLIVSLVVTLILTLIWAVVAWFSHPRKENRT